MYLWNVLIQFKCENGKIVLALKSGINQICAQYIAQVTEKQNREDIGYRVRLDFKNLMQLIRKDRQVIKAVAAGSVPPEMKEVWKQLQKSSTGAGWGASEC